jgi:glycosyltransferase involved in cell wall biosynthesis
VAKNRIRKEPKSHCYRKTKTLVAHPAKKIFVPPFRKAVMQNLLPHIAFVCSRLDQPGGIERACVNTANLFAAKGYRVTIVVADITANSFYPLLPGVQIVQENLHFGINTSQNWLARKLAFVRDIRRLRKLVQQLSPNLLIATEYPFAIAAVLSGLRKKTRIISWEHFHFFELEKSRFWGMLLRFCYPRLSGVVVLNQDEKRLFQRLNKQCTVIPNFIEAATNESSGHRRKRILTVAHLSAHKKGFDIFPDIARKVLADNPGWEWKVIGRGEMSNSLSQFTAAQGLQDRLHLQPPSSPNLDAEYVNAAVFVLTSRFECFPMTMLEAMNNGLPCVAFDCETGPRAIIQPTVNGLLAERENPDALVSVLNELLHSDEMIERMSVEAVKSVAAFSPEVVYERWRQFFTLLLPKAPSDQSVNDNTANP